MRLVDLSHTISDGLITYPGLPGPGDLRTPDLRRLPCGVRRGHRVLHRPDRDGVQHRHLPGHAGPPAPRRSRPQRADAREVRPAPRAGGRGRSDRRHRSGGVRGPRRRRPRGAGAHRLGPALRHRGVRRARAPVPRHRGRRVAGRPGGRAGRDRLGQHRRHPRRRAAGAHAAARARDPGRRAPHRALRAAADRGDVHRRTSQGRRACRRSRSGPSRPWRAECQGSQPFPDDLGCCNGPDRLVSPGTRGNQHPAPRPSRPSGRPAGARCRRRCRG